MRNLDDIAVSCNTDKSSRSHRYTKVYSELFDPMRFGIKNVCEIGIQYGGSLKMWAEYFTNAKIVGIDVDQGCIQRVHPLKAIIHSASDKGIVPLLQPEGPFDIIIDDGSHATQDQIKSFELLFPLVKDSGYYIIEDIYILRILVMNFITF